MIHRLTRKNRRLKPCPKLNPAPHLIMPGVAILLSFGGQAFSQDLKEGDEVFHTLLRFRSNLFTTITSDDFSRIHNWLRCGRIRGRLFVAIVECSFESLVAGV